MGSFPQPESSEKRIGVAAQATTRRQLSQLLRVASAEHNVIGIENIDQAAHCIDDMFDPFFFAQPLQSPVSHMVLIGPSLVGEVTQFHGNHGPIYDQSRTETCSQA